MDDQNVWNQGLHSVKRILAELPDAQRQPLAELLNDYRCEKEALAAVLLKINSDSACRVCAGQCCFNGKYRVNVLDMFSHCIADISLSPAFEQKPFCPYGTVSGCMMEAGFRPADCIVFICDDIENQLAASDRSELAVRETALRRILNKASRLLDMPLAAPLLLWAEKYGDKINS